MNRALVVVACCGIALVSGVRMGHARPLTVAIEAEVTSVWDPDCLGGQVAVGDIIKGTYTYETTAAPARLSGIEYEFSSAPCGIVLQAGDLVFQTDPNNVVFTVRPHNNGLSASLSIIDRFNLDSFENLPVLGGISVSHISIELEDRCPYGESRFVTGLLSFVLPATAPVIDQWPVRTLWISGFRADTRNSYSIVGRLISAAGPRVVETLYVDDDACGLGDGSSWLEAYPCLQDALVDANTADGPVEIRVAQGIYRPDEGHDQVPGNRAATFPLASQIELRGGYAGLAGTDPNARDIRKYGTVLSGDLNGDDLRGFRNTADNSLHVVSAARTDETAILDGFIIVSGNADGSLVDTEPAPDANAVPTTGCGGGIYIDAARPTISRCVFRANWAAEGGGGVYFSGGPIRFSDCEFSGNAAAYAGGAIWDAGSTPYAYDDGMLLERTLFQGNSALLGAAIFRSTEQFTSVSNCTFAGNRAFVGAVIDKDASVESGRIALLNSIVMNAAEFRPDNRSLWYYFYHDYCDLVGYDVADEVNTDVDPLFAEPGWWSAPDDPEVRLDPADANAVWGEGDYHLRSQAGRWDRSSVSWVIDDVTSPCIDAGSPALNFEAEPDPNGGRINMGAYGGTPEASKSYP